MIDRFKCNMSGASVRLDGNGRRRRDLLLQRIVVRGNGNIHQHQQNRGGLERGPEPPCFWAFPTDSLDFTGAEVPKQRVSEDQYLDELNRHLRADENYEEGMEFLPSPPGASGRGMSGYTMTGRFTNWHWLGVYARVAHKVAENFEI